MQNPLTSPTVSPRHSASSTAGTTRSSCPSDDVAKNEERAYLLMYLREFAGPAGTLPADFDGLVRDALGDLVRAVAT